ncbi:MAG: MlaD family protein [Thermoleophilaceae bacterium]
MRRLIAAAGVLALVVGAAVLTATKDSTPAGTTYKIVFDNAFGLTEGGDFRVGGVNAGKTTKFRATSSEPPKAEVTAQITRPGFDDLRKDASCNIKPQSLIGEYYVDCQSGSRDKPSIKPGGTVPVKQTTSTIPQDLVNNILRRPYKERLRLVINELGTGLAGRPKDLQSVLKRAHPGLRETSRTLEILGDQNRTIANFISDSDTVVTELEARKREVTRFIREAGDTASITATRREALRQTFRKLPGFLDELTPTMQRLGQLTDEQIPLLADAQRAAPSLNTFLGRLGPFADASRPALKSLGKTSVRGTKAFRNGAQEIRALKRLAANAPATAKPLRQFLASLDDRRRAIDEDPRGKAGGPPANDISNKGQANNGGFTGLESFWSYFFWQTLALNSFDSVSHVLRVGATLTECSPLENRTLQSNPELKAKFDKCNAYLGPNQPGVTTPDFTRAGRAASVSRQADKPASKAGERRSAGQPDAGPVAGQKDVSKPQVTLPPEVKRLVDGLPKLPEQTKRQIDSDKVDRLLSGKGPQSQSGTPPTSQQLLDYLMAP